MTRPQGRTIWFTGLSSSGKTTLSLKLGSLLESRGVPVVLLDGDTLRAGLNRDLGFSALDRAENIRRAGETAKILCNAGHTVIAAFITPLESLRLAVRRLFPPRHFVEVYLQCPLAVCEARDPKGLYHRARTGEIPEFTGISSPFEPPRNSEVLLSTGDQPPEECLATLLSYLEGRFPDLAGPHTDVRFNLQDQDPAFRGTGQAGGATQDADLTYLIANRYQVPQERERKRVFVLGLDGAGPSLVFDRPREELPNLHALMEHGIWGPLRSTDPPITIPAWTCMTTGKDPGELGLYGFRNRIDHSYDEMTVAASVDADAPRVWDLLESHGKTAILVGVPQTYPPRPHVGITVPGVPGFDGDKMVTYPPELAPRLAGMAGGDYMMDVTEFRTDDKDRLLQDLYTMVDRRFRLACELATSKPWDFFMMVEIATDRIHHGFWRYCNPDHGLYEPGNPYELAIRDFYRHIDSWIGTLLARLDDDTTVMVVSDHGAKTLAGGVAINEWLIEKGFLKLRNPPTARTAITPDMVDWSETSAWSEGGYYARIFLNVKGREPNGIIDQADVASFRDRLADLIKAIPDESGVPMATRVLKPEEIYRKCTRVPPDLIVYFDDLKRRSIGTVGTGCILQPSNDTGPDDANHDMHGIFISTPMGNLRRGAKSNRRIENASLLDFTPSVLTELAIRLPDDPVQRLLVNDQSVESRKDKESAPTDLTRPRSVIPAESSGGFTSAEEELVKKRLEELGYI